MDFIIIKSLLFLASIKDAYLKFLAASVTPK